MTRRALERLGREDRFLLQVEGGRVDHAAHANDIASAVHEVVAFDEALEVCLEFQRSEPDTLLVITTDHGTANPGLNSMGGGFGDKSQPLFHHVQRASASFSTIQSKLTAQPSAGELQRAIADFTGYQAPDRKVAAFARFFAKQGFIMYDVMNSVSAQLGQLLGNHYGVGWTSGEHTADFVPLLARGPGAERFAGFLQGTDIFHRYLALAGIDFRNPELPLMAESGPSAGEAERPHARV
jgi:alkaline phosphatase